MIMNEELVVAGLPLQFPKPTAGSQLPTLAEWNQRYIEYVLGFTKGKKTAAARILGINRRTLYRRKKNKSALVEPDAHLRPDSRPDSRPAEVHPMLENAMPTSLDRLQ